MIYFDLKPDAECFTFCQGKTIIKTFLNMCIYFLIFPKKSLRCHSYKMRPTKNCSCRYEVLRGHRRYALVHRFH